MPHTRPLSVQSEKAERPTRVFLMVADLTPLTNSHDERTDGHFTLRYTTNFEDLVDFVYPDLSEGTRVLNDRAILATTNALIDTSNDTTASKRPGSAATFCSSYTLVTDETNPGTAFAPPEHLNQFNVQGAPPHELNLKYDALAMSVRNLNLAEGLVVNGRKVVLRGVSPHSRVVHVELLPPEKTTALIPRIVFSARVGRDGVSFHRVQPALRIA